MNCRVRVRVARPTALVVVLALGLAGAFGTGAALLAAPAHASRLQAPPSFDEYDEAMVAELMGEGFSEGEALFLALTKVHGRAVGDRRVRITESFPTGNRAVINVSVVPDKAGGEPGTPKVKSHTSGGGFSFSLEYFVADDAIPVDVRETIDAALANRAAAPAVLAGYSWAPSVPLSAPAGTEANGVQVLVEGVVEKFVGDKASDFAQFLDRKLGTGAKLDGFLEALNAGLSVADALALSNEFDALKAQMDALEKCAKNPTNPHTKKAYKDNPGERDRILKQIESTRAEVTASTAVSFIGHLNNTASGLIKSAPWLGYVTGPGTAWSQETLGQVNQELINDLKKAIVPCGNDLRVTSAHFEGTGIGNRGTKISGTKCDGPAGDWVLMHEAGGVLTFTLDENGRGGWWELNVPATDWEGSWSSSGLMVVYDPAAKVLTFDQLGSTYQVPVEVGSFCKDGVPNP